MTDHAARTLVEAHNDLAYNIRLQERHVRFLKRLRAVLAFVVLCGGATAFSELVNTSPFLRGLAAVLVAGCAFTDVLADFAGRAAAHDQQRRRYLELRSRSAGLGLEEIDRELARIEADDPTTIQALCLPAMNDVLRSRGYEDAVRPLGVVERLVDAIG